MNYFQGEQISLTSAHCTHISDVLSPNSRMFSFVLRMCQCILTSASGCQQRVCWGLCTDGWAGDFSKPNPSVLPGLPVLQTTLIAILYLQHRHTISFWGKELGKSLNKGKISYVGWAQLVPAACVGNHRCLLDLHTGTQQTCAVCIVHCTNAFNIRVSEMCKPERGVRDQKL